MMSVGYVGDIVRLNGSQATREGEMQGHSGHASEDSWYFYTTRLYHSVNMTKNTHTEEMRRIALYIKTRIAIQL